ncbi:hypothetical protein R1sor_019688 [Riccia sorocarpa]|uniref:Reverse transcriptase Ty1/copia-type domain-containing protein n=1 Tax=Riccia sorocarpa TaxID=122646 RepID=A0ABD3IHE4_9MARC
MGLQQPEDQGKSREPTSAESIAVTDAAPAQSEETVEDEDVEATEEVTEDVMSLQDALECESGGSIPSNGGSISMSHGDMTREPVDYQEASKTKHWQLAMDEEFRAHMENQTWKLVDLPSGRKAIRCKWVYKTKLKADGRIARHKARLVAKGFSQVAGIDYNETYSPVVRFESMRTVMSIAAAEDMEITQFDVKTAFIKSELDETIYMEQPEGYVAKGKEDMVCLLQRAIYGLKQSSRVWNLKFTELLQEYQLEPTTADPCVFLRKVEPKIIITIFVDDGLVCCRDRKTIEDMMCYLNKRLEVTFGNAEYYVGLQIIRDRKERSLCLSQTRYIQEVARRFGMIDSRPTSTPMDPNVHFGAIGDGEKERMQGVPYQEAIGSLMWAMMGTRFDIEYSMSMLAKYNSNPSHEHWLAVKRLIRYVNCTAKYVVRFGPVNSQHTLVWYCDSDYAADVDTRRSRSGYVFMLNGGPIAWSSQRQPSVATSTTEAEYIASCTAAKELVWLQRLLAGIDFEQTSPTVLNIDNNGAIRLIHNPEFHKRTKHVGVQFHYVREVQEAGELTPVYLSTTQQLADILTKALPADRFSRLRSQIGLNLLNT